jgi:hypothetical protein
MQATKLGQTICAEHKFQSNAQISRMVKDPFFTGPQHLCSSGHCWSSTHNVLLRMQTGKARERLTSRAELVDRIPSRITALRSGALSPTVLTLPEPYGEKPIEQRFVVDASSFGGLRKFLAVADVGIWVGLKKVRPPLGIEAEVHARVAA